jgi:predicted nucleotidyltransferase
LSEQARKIPGLSKTGAILLSGKTMDALLVRNLGEIDSLCRQCGVKKLAAFGSILRSDFNPASSDVDFLVEFEPAPVTLRLRNYLTLRSALQSLLTRPVDLVEDGAIRNPYVREDVVRTQQVLYAA